MCHWAAAECAPKKGSAGQSAASPSLSPGLHPELQGPRRPATHRVPPNLTDLSLLGSTEVICSEPSLHMWPHVASSRRGRNGTMVFKNSHDNCPVRFPHSCLTVTSREVPHVGWMMSPLLRKRERGTGSSAAPRPCRPSGWWGALHRRPQISGLGLRAPIPMRGSAPNLNPWVPGSLLPPPPRLREPVSCQEEAG